MLRRKRWRRILIWLGSTFSYHCYGTGKACVPAVLSLLRFLLLTFSSLYFSIFLPVFHLLSLLVLVDLAAEGSLRLRRWDEGERKFCQKHENPVVGEVVCPNSVLRHVEERLYTCLHCICMN